MSTEKRLIDANALLDEWLLRYTEDERKGKLVHASCEIKQRLADIVCEAPTMDAVEVDVLKAWLYEIAMNNVENSFCEACEEIISRLDGLRVFARERRAEE